LLIDGRFTVLDGRFTVFRAVFSLPFTVSQTLFTVRRGVSVGIRRHVEDAGRRTGRVGGIGAALFAECESSRNLRRSRG
jgi:hypothetical protein